MVAPPPPPPAPPLPLRLVAHSKPLPTTRSTHEHLNNHSNIKLSHRHASVRDFQIATPGFDRSDSTTSLDSNSSSSSFGSMPATPTSELESRSPLSLGTLHSSSTCDGYSARNSTSTLRLPSPITTTRRQIPSLDRVATAAQSPPRSRSSSVSSLPTAILSHSHSSRPITPTRRNPHGQTTNVSPTSMAAGGSFLGRLLGKGTAASIMKASRRVVVREDDDDDEEFVVVL